LDCCFPRFVKSKKTKKTPKKEQQQKRNKKQTKQPNTLPSSSECMSVWSCIMGCVTQ